MKTNIDQKIDGFIIRNLGNKAGHAYKLASDWCNHQIIPLLIGGAIGITVLVILNMQHIK